MDAPVTGIALVDWFLRLLAVHGYVVVLAATTLENLFVVGTLTPGETVVAAAGVVAASGRIHPVPIVIASVAGTVIGSNVSYLVGRRGGRPALERWGHRFFVSERRLRASEEYFRRHGSKTVLIARFAAGAKNFVPLIAGASRMPVAYFEGYTLVGALAYSTVLVTLGYFFGENLDVLLRVVGRLGYGGLALLAALLLLLWWGYRRRLRRPAEEGGADG